jgi:mannose-6-phosphate isomerase-like protein (cupin superfamily)
MEFDTFDTDDFRDELATAAQNRQIGTTVLMENERVRVWDLTVEPGGRIPFHCHTTSYFFTCVEGGRMINRFPDGNQVTLDMDDGATWFSAIDAEPEIHDLENVGPTRVRFITVELLTD